MFSDKSTRINKLYNSRPWKPKLIELFTSLLRYTDIDASVIPKVFDDHKTDKEIIEALAEMNTTPQEPYSEEVNIRRGFSRWKTLRPVVQRRKLRINGLLDYGGNVGDIAHAVGSKALGLKKEQIYVIDIDDFAGIEWKARDDITFVHFNDIEKMPANSVDVIMANHTLHHIDAKHYPKIIEMFNKALTKNGIIMLYEHDCSHRNMPELIDLEHCIYDTIVSKKMTYDKFAKTFYAKYLSIAKWEKVFAKHFKPFDLVEKRNIDNSFFMFLERC